MAIVALDRANTRYLFWETQETLEVFRVSQKEVHEKNPHLRFLAFGAE